MSLPTIEKLNTVSESEFIEAVNTLFETAPPLAAKLLARRPYTSYGQLIDYAEALCVGSEFSTDEKLEVINAHPRIGENKGNLSAMSLKEQGYTDKVTAVSTEDEKVNARLAELNKVNDHRDWPDVRVSEG